MLSSVPPTDCMLAREHASARLDGELSELDGLRLDAHLATCAECAAFAASLDAVATELRGAALEPAPAGMFLARRRRTRPQVAAVAAVLVVAAAAGTSFFLGQELGGRTPATPPLVRGTVSAAPRIDPGLVAMLRGERGWTNQNRRAVAL